MYLAIREAECSGGEEVVSVHRMQVLQYYLAPFLSSHKKRKSSKTIQ